MELYFQVDRINEDASGGLSDPSLPEHKCMAATLLYRIDEGAELFNSASKEITLLHWRARAEGLIDI